MGRVKDLYIEEVERHTQELMDQGMSEEEAYEKAGDLAYKSVGDRMADMADMARQLKKEGQP